MGHGERRWYTQLPVTVTWPSVLVVVLVLGTVLVHNLFLFELLEGRPGASLLSRPHLGRLGAPPPASFPTLGTVHVRDWRRHRVGRPPGDFGIGEGRGGFGLGRNVEPLFNVLSLDFHYASLYAHTSSF